MKRTRRSKNDMSLMSNECTLYLLENNLNPHKAYDAMIKDYLTSGKPIPYYIKGIKDFIKVSQCLAARLEREECMSKKDKERHQQKEKIIDYILNLSKNEIKFIYKKYKDIVTHSEKLAIVDLCHYVYSDFAIDKKDIDQASIKLFTRIYNDQRRERTGND